jgi:hypothetical protein
MASTRQITPAVTARPEMPGPIAAAREHVQIWKGIVPPPPFR